MAPRKNAKGAGGHSSGSGGGSGSGSPSSGSSGGSSSSPGSRREAKHKNGRKGGISGSSFFTWFMVIALLGVWTSVAVVWFDLVDYEEVLGKLGVYDADGDGDFDVEDAKVLLGLKERSASEQTFPPEKEEPHTELEEQAPEGSEPQNIEDEVKEQIQSLLHELVHTEHGEDHRLEADGPAGEPQPEDSDLLTAPGGDDRLETDESEKFPEETEDSYHVEETVPQDPTHDVEEVTYDHENPDPSEPAADVDRLHLNEDEVTYHNSDEPVHEPTENEEKETSDNAIEESIISEDSAIEDSAIISEEINVSPLEDQQDTPPDT